MAIVGKPNVGKSSLLNKLAGQRRVVVDEVAGTTVDPVDQLVDPAATSIGRSTPLGSAAGSRKLPGTSTTRACGPMARSSARRCALWSSMPASRLPSKIFVS